MSIIFQKCIFALDAGGSFLKAGLFDLNGELLPSSEDREAVNSDGTLDEVKKAYAALIHRMKNTAEKHGCLIDGVAIDIPGPFDYATGTSHMKHKYTAIYGISLIPWFQEILGNVRMMFMHDSAAFLSGVATQNPQYQSIAGVMIGTGLGFAMMKNGRILSSETGGPLLSIYNKPFRDGIAEDYISARGIVNRYNAIVASPIHSGKSIGLLAEQGIEPARTVYAETGSLLGELIAPILCENGIQALYLGGQISKSFSVFREPLTKALSDVSTLRVIEAAENLDMAHLRGSAAEYLKLYF